MHFKQTVAQQMAGNEEWQMGTIGVVVMELREIGD